MSEQHLDKGLQSSRKVIAFTGGGSAGHVTPNLALIEHWLVDGGRAIYFGRKKSVEEELLSDHSDIPFLAVPSERLRRYFHWGNFKMPLIVVAGIVKAYFLMRRHRPALLFSKGGFVALPVVIGAWLNRIPVLIHESDGSLGLANRLSAPFSKVICLAQERAQMGIKHHDVRVTGSPLRRSFLNADSSRAIDRFGLNANRPLIVVFGGSQGAQKINEALWNALDQLLTQYEIFHVTGPDQCSQEADLSYQDRGYHQAEYIREGFADLLAQAWMVVGRAGANAVAELVALKKPALLIPLPSASSRGDQLLNAEAFVARGGGRLLSNEDLTSTQLIKELEIIQQNHTQHVQALAQQATQEGTEAIIQICHELILDR